MTRTYAPRWGSYSTSPSWMSWRMASRTALRPVPSVPASDTSRSASPCGMRPSMIASRSSRRTCSVMDARSTLERRQLLASDATGLLRWTVDNHTIAVWRGSRRAFAPVDRQIRPLVGLSTMAGDYRSPLRSDANAGRVALVTGGGTGLGRATALELARSGAGIVLAGRREEPLERTRGDIAAAGADCIAVSADVREPDEVDRIVTAALDRFGRV